MAAPPLSLSAAIVLQAVANGYAYGFDVMDATGLPGGTVYPALRRLEEAGLMSSSWEKQSVADAALRPSRKYYELTRSGRETLKAALARYPTLSHPLAARAHKPSRQRD
jgi:DNA-binding PadR family transcriptional regulator